MSPRRAPSLPALILLTGVSPLATDMYLPALPGMARELHSSAAVMGLTLTAFLIGIALGQIALGPISDAFGRRPFVVGGPIAFLLLSLACAAAPNGPLLVAIRFLQGLAGAAGVVCGRAVISDFYRGGQADRRQAAAIAAGLIGPVVAPGIGGLILTVGSWRTIFLVLSAVAVLMVVGGVFGVPETLPPAERHPPSVRATVGRMGELLSDRRFRTHVITGALATCGFFTYIGGSSFVLQDHYGISASRYSLVFAVNATAMVITSAVTTALIIRVGARLIRIVGLVVTTAATAVLLASAVGRFDSFALTWVLLACVTAGMGLVLPSTLALGQRAGRRYAGTASALQGGLQFAAGALMTPMAALLGAHSLLPMALLMSAFMVASLAYTLVLGRPDDRTAQAAQTA